jgi:hypothetical protein
MRCATGRWQRAHSLPCTPSCWLEATWQTDVKLRSDLRSSCVQLIRPMMDYACPICRSAACTHLIKPQVIQSKCLRIATGAPWYMSNVQIHEDLGVPLFAEHIRTLTESFDSRLAGVGNPSFEQLSRHLRWPRADPSRLAQAMVTGQLICLGP